MLTEFPWTGERWGGEKGGVGGADGLYGKKKILRSKNVKWGKKLKKYRYSWVRRARFLIGGVKKFWSRGRSGERF